MYTQQNSQPYPGTGTAGTQPGYPPYGGTGGQQGYPQYAGAGAQQGYPQYAGTGGQQGYPLHKEGHPSYPYPGAQDNYPPQPAYPQPKPNLPDNKTTAPPPDQHFPSANDEADNAKSFNFNTASIRRGFIRKVYSLLTLQLIVTFGLVLLFCLHQGVKAYAKKNIWLLIVGLIVYLAAIIALACCEGVRRTHPTNLIFMSFFTLGSGILFGYTGAAYAPETVAIAMGLTAIMSVGLTIFAIQTKWDFTKLGGGLFIALLLFTVVGIIAAIMRSHYLEIILAYVGVVLFSIYLIHDTQQIIGGNHKYHMNPEEYVLGAIALYLDIMQLFVYLLRIVAAAKD